MVSTDLQTHVVSLSEIVPYAGNAKEHPEWQVDQLVSSIEKFGNCDPIAAWHNLGVDMEYTQNNTLGQLNIELFAQLHRLREVDVSDEAALKAEIERSKAVEGISHNIIDNAKVIMDATRMRATFSQQTTVPRMLEG